MFENLVEILKKNPRKIVYTEGTDARILESAARLKADGFLTPVLVGNAEEVKAAPRRAAFDIDGLEILDPENYEGFDAMVDEMVALRRGQAERRGLRRRAPAVQLLRHHARQDGPRPTPCWRRDLLHGGHRASRRSSSSRPSRARTS